MLIPKKQMAVAVLILVILIVISAYWVIESTKDSNGDFNGDKNGDGNGNIIPPDDRLPFIKITILEKTDCTECLPIDVLVDSIKENFDVNILEVKRVDSDSKEGQDLIKMHGIEKLPTLIINGEFKGTELEAQWPLIGEEKNGVLILTEVQPPYYSLTEERLVGGVTFLLIENSSCSDCVDLNFFSEVLENYGILIEEKIVLDYNSKEAEDFFYFYLIDRVPVLILIGDAEAYPLFSSDWTQWGGNVEDDGAFIYRDAVPYYDLLSEEVKGLVELTKLVDENCLDCVDISYLVEPLLQMGLVIVKEETFDISSEKGIELIEKYEIKKAPTIIVSKEAEEYLDFFVVWPEVGTQESDGVFIFRNLEIFDQNFTTLE